MFSEIIDEELGEKAIAEILYNSEIGLCLLSDGKLYSFIPEDSKFDKDFELTYIADNVKTLNKKEDYYLFYLTKDNKLYSGNNELIIENVKEYGDSYLITTANELYKYNHFNKKYDYMANNVRKGSYDYYINANNELYIYNYHNEKFEYIAGNVKDGDENYYITTSKELYNYNYGNKKYEYMADNVKEGDGYYYITTTNDLYEYNIYNNKYEYTASNVKEYYDYIGHLFYITTLNDLYEYNSDNEKYEYIAGNVRKHSYQKYYTNTIDDLYVYISNKYENVGNIKKEIIDYGSDFYITTNNTMRAYIKIHLLL